jgi:hypothetical protein
VGCEFALAQGEHGDGLSLSHDNERHRAQSARPQLQTKHLAYVQRHGVREDCQPSRTKNADTHNDTWARIDSTVPIRLSPKRTTGSRPSVCTNAPSSEQAIDGAAANANQLPRAPRARVFAGGGRVGYFSCTEQEMVHPERLLRKVTPITRSYS